MSVLNKKVLSLIQDVAGCNHITDQIVNKTADRMYMIYIRIALANYCKSEFSQHKQCPKSPVRSNAQNMI